MASKALKRVSVKRGSNLVDKTVLVVYVSMSEDINESFL